MIIPHNGRIVIVDDKFEEISGLMEVLSKEGLSFSYFNGSVETLPEISHPLENTFLVFLDLELDGSAVNNDVTQASQVISVLSRILGDAASDYSVIIVAWSGALNILNELKPRMEIAKINPLAFLEIDKSSCKQNGAFEIELIKKIISERMSQIPSLNLIYYWDKLVGQATHDVYKKILPRVPLISTDLNVRLNSIYKELATACLGQEVKVENTYATLNLLNSILSNEVGKYAEDITLPLDIANCSPISLEDRGTLNFSINMVSAISSFSPGCVIPDTDEASKFDCAELFSDTNSKDKAIKMEPDLLQNMTSVLCEVTPLCDHTQKRSCYHRLIPGRMLPTTVSKWIKTCDYYYATPVFYLNNTYGNKPFYIIFDLRRLFTVEFSKVDSPKILFQFSETLLMHIQNRLGRQVSNPGITFI